MEISTQLDTQYITIEDNHLFNIQNNINIWEQFQTDNNIAQKKLVQTTSLLQTEGLQNFSLNITIPSTYFAGLEEHYSIGFTLDKPIDNTHSWNHITNNEPTKMDFNYHRVNSIYAMNHVIQIIFNSLKQKFSHTDIDDIEILTSLIVFEMEQLSKSRVSNTHISQEMFLLNQPHVKWVSKIDLHSQFNDYLFSQQPTYYH